MIVSKAWLEELVNLKVPVGEVIDLLPLRTIGVKEVTDKSFELDMKGYNRADLLSMRGVAYEIAAITDSHVKFEEPDEDTYIWEKKNLSNIQVSVENDLLCPVYCIAKISGLKVGPSPKEWVEKLESAGMRSVNNVADITNLIMLEYGQPQHAFDADRVFDEALIVRDGKNEEKFITLDNKERALEKTDLVISDKNGAVGLAGVMGGKNSEVSESTTSILLEAAIFDAKSIRKTAQRLNLHSEASKRFQHGLTKKRLLQSLDASIRMLEQIGGKLEAVSLNGDFDEHQKEVVVSHKKISNLIGVEIKPEFVKSSLEKFHFKASLGDKNEWEVIPPYWRLDISIAEDVIEEVARLYGYETLPPKALEGEQPEKIDQSQFEFVYKLQTTLAKTGFFEIQTYSFYSTKVIDNLNLKKDELIKIANPMSKETEYMRDHLWPNLLEKVADNLKHLKTVPLFEIGKVYSLNNQKLPEERMKLAVALSNKGDKTITDLHTLFEKVLQKVGLDIAVAKAGQNDNPKGFHHPARVYCLENKQGQKLGLISEIHPRIVNKFGVENRVAILEIDLFPTY